MTRNIARFLWASFLWVSFSGVAQAADRVEALDKNKDGKPDTWYYYRNDVIYKKEYDRNFDGKPDFGIIIEGQKLVEKKYDDNFDGKFEKTVKSPAKGSNGRLQTTPSA